MTTPIDVNTAFRAERITQIANASDRTAELDKQVAAGTLKKLSDGRYRVETGYDKGEYLSQTGTPLHGLDLVNGEAQLYTAGPTSWHGLGNHIPEGISDIGEVLKLSGLDWLAVSTPVRYVDHTGKLRQVDDRFANFRDDTGDLLGIIGSHYEAGGIVQNRAGFEFLQDLFDRYDVIWQSAGPLHGGKKTFVSMRLPEGVTVDAEGVNDHIDLYVVAINSFDGKSPFMTLVTPWRPECANTERFAIRDAITTRKVRHTRKALDNLEEARLTLKIGLTYQAAFSAEEELLAQTSLAIDGFREIVQSEDLWPIADDATKNAKTRHTNKMEIIEGLWAANTAKLGRTAYAAERAITEYIDHHTPVKAPKSLTEDIVRATRALEGTDDGKKNTAHRQLLLRTNR